MEAATPSISRSNKPDDPQIGNQSGGLNAEAPSSDAPVPSSSAPADQEPHTKPVVTQEPEDDAKEQRATPPNPRVTALNKKRIALEAKFTDLQAHRSALVSQAKLPSGLDMPAEWTEDQRRDQALKSANVVIKDHIKALHRYNEIRDIGLGLLGLVAEKRGVRQAAIMDEFGVSEKD